MTQEAQSLTPTMELATADVLTLVAALRMHCVVVPDAAHHPKGVRARAKMLRAMEHALSTGEGPELARTPVIAGADACVHLVALLDLNLGVFFQGPGGEDRTGEYRRRALALAHRLADAAALRDPTVEEVLAATQQQLDRPETRERLLGAGHSAGAGAGIEA